MYFNTCRLNYDFEMNRHKTDKKRKYCNHCDDYVSMRTYFRHKVYVDRPRNTDDSLAVDDSESDEQSEIGKLVVI